MTKALEIINCLTLDNKAKGIYNMYNTYKVAREVNFERKRETLEYLYATTTKDIKTQVPLSDWRQSTHLPKLTQIRDTMINMYKSYIFSIRNYIDWEGFTEGSHTLSLRKDVRDFAQEMFDRAKLKEVTNKLLEDYVDIGEAYCMGEYKELFKSEGAYALGYDFAAPVRISPFTIYYDPTCSSFEGTPKIIAKTVSLGELTSLAASNQTMKEALDKVLANRESYSALDTEEKKVVDAELELAGLGNIFSYEGAYDNVLLLTFYGNLYDPVTHTLSKDRKITVLDGTIVVADEDLTIKDTILRVGWREQKDTLHAMGPLENLLGMQYRIDLLENARAEIFDAMSNPIIFIKGDVTEPEELIPGATYRGDSDADVRYILPPSNVLDSDTQILQYERRMEEYVGITRDSTGIRTPGEKTAFEYNGLVTSGLRNIEQQVRHFEQEMFQPLVNLLLQLYIANTTSDVVTFKTYDEEEDAYEFKKLNIKGLLTSGELKAVGSLTYAEKSRIATTLAQLDSSPLFNDDGVRNNFSPTSLGKTILYATGLDKFHIFKKNARIFELAEQQQTASVAQDNANQVLALRQADEMQAQQDAGAVITPEQPTE